MEEFKRDLNELGISFVDEQIDRFIRYYEMIIEWNKVMNLTGITEFSQVLKKHFIDSLSLVKAVPIEELSVDGFSLIDVGTGAGFPGLPLKIMFPDMRVTLMDSLGKRVKFLQAVCDELGLTGITAVHGRAEDGARDSDHRDAYDMCVSRAVAAMPVLCEYCMPFVKTGGYFAAYKTEKAEGELEGSEKGLAALNGKLCRKVSFMLPGTDIERNIILIEKTGSTSKKYPRKAGTPQKEPLW